MAIFRDVRHHLELESQDVVLEPIRQLKRIPAGLPQCLSRVMQEGSVGAVMNSGKQNYKPRGIALHPVVAIGESLTLRGYHLKSRDLEHHSSMTGLQVRAVTPTTS